MWINVNQSQTINLELKAKLEQTAAGVTVEFGFENGVMTWTLAGASLDEIRRQIGAVDGWGMR